MRVHVCVSVRKCVCVSVSECVCPLSLDGVFENKTRQSSQMLTVAPPFGADSWPSSRFSIRSQGITPGGKDNLSLTP